VEILMAEDDKCDHMKPHKVQLGTYKHVCTTCKIMKNYMPEKQQTRP